MGCGPGRDTQLLRAAGLRVAGFDLSAAQLRAGGLEGVAQADMRALPLADSTVDGVWCQAALLHLPRELAPAALAEFARVTRTGGALLLTVAEGDFEGYQSARIKRGATCAGGSPTTASPTCGRCYLPPASG